MSTTEVKVPDIGDFDAVEVIEILISPGDTIKEEQSLITLESDKAAMEIPSSAAGVVKDVKVKVGDKIGQGAVICIVEASAAAPASTPTANAPAQTSAAVPSETKAEAAPTPASFDGDADIKAEVDRKSVV